MRPTLRQLQYIVVVSETNSFNEAAGILNVSQPSLSTQIFEAENQLGIKLFERGRNGAFATPEGEEIVRRARTILTQVEDLKTAARQASNSISGKYRLGTLPTIGPYLLPFAVKELHVLYPELRMSVREEATIHLEEKLQDGQLDMVLSTKEDHPNSEHMVLFDEALYVYAAQDDPISSKSGPISLNDLKGRDVLSLGYGHRLSLIVQKLADKAGAHVSTQYEGTSLDAVRQMADMGAGIAILPSLYALSAVRRDNVQTIRPIRHAMASRTISLIWRRNSPLAENIQKLGSVFRDIAKKQLSFDS